MDAFALVLPHFREVLRRLQDEARHHEARWGTPPTVLLVEECAPSSDGLFDTGAVLRRWRVTAEAAQELATGDALPPQQSVGMYYDAGRGSFSVLGEPPVVRIGWQVGPRYGRGYHLAIEHTDRGEPRLGQRCGGSWIS